MYKYTLYVDGGSLGNGTPEAQGYGSCMITRPDTEKTRTVRFNFGVGDTSNEAEYQALIAALKHIKETWENVAFDTQELELTIRMDSALVIGQMSMGWNINKASLRDLNTEAKKLVSAFGKVEFIKISEKEMKRILGH